MRKTFISVLMICLMLIFMLTACNSKKGKNPPVTPPEDNKVNIDNNFQVTSNILIVYFSKTNTTESVALKIKELTNADIFEVERKEAYPNEYNSTTKIAKDEKESNARPELKTYLSRNVIESYDTIFIGFPIWWHTVPMPILSFLNFYDFTGKTIYTFCTSGGSPITESTNDIRINAQGATIIEGKKFSQGDNDIQNWISSLNLEQNPITSTESLTYEKNGNEYAVTGIINNDKNIIIPSEYRGLPVTIIRESAFAYSRHNEDILSVTIPDSVIIIERNAFYNRNEMVSVNIGKNSKLEIIGNNAFSGNYSLKNIYIPSSVNSIGDSAFNNDGIINFTVADENNVYCSENGHLIEKSTNTLIYGGQNKNIPEGIKIIAQAAFRNSKLTELNIPSSVSKINNYIIANSLISIINFMGTEDEWNAIDKSKMWNFQSDTKIKFNNEKSKVLIVYFTAEYGNTEKLANYIHSQIDGDIIKIEAAHPYTSQELNYSIHNNRPEIEKNTNARPEIAISTYNAIDINKYDTIFIGYPIWWHTAPMIIGTFLEHYDLTGYEIYPFTQSASMNTTHFDNSMEFIRRCATKSGSPIIHDGLFARANSTTVIENYLKANGFIL